MKTVKIREKQQETYRNQNVIGCNCYITVVTKTGYTFPGTLPKLENIQVKGILNRNGKDNVLFNETLKNVLYLSEWDTPVFDYVKAGAAPITLDGFNPGGVDTFLWPFKFDFGGIINLDGSDALTLEVTCNSGAFNTTELDENACFINFEVMEGVGLETYTPYIKSRVIEASQSNPTFDLGDNVLEILIANFDRTVFRKSLAVVNNISIDSDKWSRNDAYEELITRNVAQFTDRDQAATRYQSFRIYSGYELDAVKLNMNLNTANVASSQNVILWYCFETNDALVTKAAVKRKKFIRINNQKGQFDAALASKMAA